MPYPGASPQIGRPSPPPQYPNVGNMLAELNPDEVRSDQKREGSDWYAVFNPNVRRVLDIDLVCNLVHDSVVCCVRFSHDGRYVATGCNRSAQIFDVATGNQVTKLQDESVDKDGDLYIRSVCFSPDGRFLATGAEDKQIRVSPSFTQFWATSSLDNIGSTQYRSGIFNLAPFDARSLVTSKIFILWILLAMVRTLLLEVVIIPSVFGTLSVIVKY